LNCTTCQRPIAADAARCEGCGAEVLAGSLVVGAQDTLLALGRRVGDRYEVLGTIGVGALGVTYRVRDHDLNSTVALKVIYRHLMFSETDERRLREWFEVVRHWGDERIAAPLRHGKSEAGYYVVAPFVEGPSLGRIESRRGPLAGPLEPHRVTALVRGLHRALDRMGDSVHGALHPSNILITPSFPVITDPAPYRAVMSGLWL
jgi:serine/threonine protein kinase